MQTAFPAGLAFTPVTVAVYVGFASGESTLDYKAFARTCNLWRVYNDIEASFDIAIWSAPLMLSVDLASVTADFKAVLQNREVIGK